MTVFKVLRFDPARDVTPGYRTYQVPQAPGRTVLESLMYIREHLDPSLSFRSSCRAAVCGSCAMKINGRYRLACHTLVESLREDVVTVEPLAHLPLLKDLVVDMTAFYEKYAGVSPFPVLKCPPPGREFSQLPRERKKLDGLLECTLCGACYAACTMVSWDSEFPGPCALLWADARVRDTREQDAHMRVRALSHEHGLWRCHTELNCTEVCPKGLSPTEAIQHLKRKSVCAPFAQVLSTVLPNTSASKEQVDRTRRALLKAAVTGGSLLAVTVLAILSRRFFVPAPQEHKRVSWIDAGEFPKQLPATAQEVRYSVTRREQGIVRHYPKRAFLVGTEDGRSLVLDPTCTHLGCACEWDDAIRNFLCPCHGGAFDLQGLVTMGPPPRHLRRIPHKFEDGRLYLAEEKSDA